MGPGGLPWVAASQQRKRPGKVPGRSVRGPYSFRCALIPARLTTLFARILIAAATTASSCAGSQTVGVGGQLMAITGGLPRFGSISSTRSGVLPLMVPAARSVRLGIRAPSTDRGS